MKAATLSLVAAALVAMVLTRPCHSEPAHGIAMHGLPKLAPGFQHFAYVNPNAPKGGRLVLGGWGSFDSLNPMIVKGEPALGVREFTIESLMARSLDEPFTLYGLIAESIDVPPERNEVTFRLNPKAHFSDGSPITADDVIFSWSLLKEKSRPNFMTYYKKVVSAERIDERTVRFVLSGADREMPLILGLMPVLPKHATDTQTFEATSLVPPIGSGPYKITRVDPGRTLTYELDPNYWGRDLPATRGRFNFAEIRFDYYRDGAVLLEAFKTGAIDVRTEEDPSRWAEAYAFAAVTSGRVRKIEIPTGLPAGMTGLVFNTRRAVFADPRVREALIHLFNFEWIDKNLFHGLYQRTESFFERSSLASTGMPADAHERALLAPFPDAVRPDVLSGTYRMPVSDGSGHNRTNARRANELLAEAGYKLSNGRLRRADGARLAFEILAGGVAQERLLNSFAGDLDKLGIDVSIRTVDSAQYQSRLKDYDFDMIQFTWPASLSPGNEQLFRWSSKVAGQPGSFNYAGIANPAVDAMIAALLAADSPQDFASSVRALDRVLLSGHYVIPLFHIPRQWVAHWDRVRHPDAFPLSGYNLDSWWIEERP